MKRGCSCAPAIWKKFNVVERKMWKAFYRQYREWLALLSEDTKTEQRILAHNMACMAVWDKEDENQSRVVTDKRTRAR